VRIAHFCAALHSGRAAFAKDALYEHMRRFTKTVLAFPEIHDRLTCIGFFFPLWREEAQETKTGEW